MRNTPSILDIPSVWKMSARLICSRSPRIVTAWPSELAGSERPLSSCSSVAAEASRNSTSASLRISPLSAILRHVRRRPSPSPFGNGAGLRVCAVAIGVLACAAQTARAQDGTAGGNGGPGWITSRDDRWRERFQALLLGGSRDLAAGWQLARDVGRPAVPLLWSMVDDERSDVDRRLVVL